MSLTGSTKYFYRLKETPGTEMLTRMYWMMGEWGIRTHHLQGILAVSVDGAGPWSFEWDVHNLPTQFFPSGFHLTSGDCVSSPVMKDLNEGAYLQFLIIPIKA